ncbi:hypothetical protein CAUPRSCDRAFT_10962 [Caulochytrium protostelioides]|uniref:Uncharacterized protein n=1 Tax=Caulochytrium protostelioides TaxID=1555241 RepID=A0A4P9WVK0_9FUNG|nr:hypothetical protein CAUPRSCDRAFT_10962 [Caulochytrium protostelioides]
MASAWMTRVEQPHPSTKPSLLDVLPAAPLPVIRPPEDGAETDEHEQKQESLKTPDLSLGSAPSTPSSPVRFRAISKWTASMRRLSSQARKTLSWTTPLEGRPGAADASPMRDAPRRDSRAAAQTGPPSLESVWTPSSSFLPPVPVPVQPRLDVTSLEVSCGDSAPPAPPLSHGSRASLMAEYPTSAGADVLVPSASYRARPVTPSSHSPPLMFPSSHSPSLLPPSPVPQLSHVRDGDRILSHAKAPQAVDTRERSTADPHEGKHPRPLHVASPPARRSVSFASSQQIGLAAAPASPGLEERPRRGLIVASRPFPIPPLERRSDRRVARDAAADVPVPTVETAEDGVGYRQSLSQGQNPNQTVSPEAAASAIDQVQKRMLRSFQPASTPHRVRPLSSFAAPAKDPHEARERPAHQWPDTGVSELAKAAFYTHVARRRPEVIQYIACTMPSPRDWLAAFLVWCDGDGDRAAQAAGKWYHVRRDQLGLSGRSLAGIGVYRSGGGAMPTDICALSSGFVHLFRLDDPSMAAPDRRHSLAALPPTSKPRDPSRLVMLVDLRRVQMHVTPAVEWVRGLFIALERTAWIASDRCPQRVGRLTLVVQTPPTAAGDPSAVGHACWGSDPERIIPYALAMLTGGIPLHLQAIHLVVGTADADPPSSLPSVTGSLPGGGEPCAPLGAWLSHAREQVAPDVWSRLHVHHRAATLVPDVFYELPTHLGGSLRFTCQLWASPDMDPDPGQAGRGPYQSLSPGDQALF